jgi:putative hydrolase of the HAD superfamily
MPSIRAIIFDAVGTLIFPEPSAPLVYAEVGRRFGSSLPIETITQRFSAAFQNQESIDRDQGWITDEKRERHRWQTIVGEVLNDVTDPERCFEFLYAHFAAPPSWRCEPAAESLINDLLAQGYRLGIASNFDTRLLALVRGLPPLQKLVENTMVSSLIGFRKPAPQFFGAVCRHLDLEAAQVLFVGDDPDNDYFGAKAAGMSAVLFDPQGKYGNWTDPRVRSLESLKGNDSGLN